MRISRLRLALLVTIAAGACTPPPPPPPGFIVWVKIPAGNFGYGCDEPPDTDCPRDETPVSTRAMAPFSMAQTETTVAQYNACVTAGACARGPGNEDGAGPHSEYPVVNVDWHQATAFCRWVGGRLPSAVEWEYAAKGGYSRIYPWGNNPPSATHANCSKGCGDRFERSAPVGSFPSGDTVHGLKDMAGNVSEWTSAAYGECCGGSAESARLREYRGGDWFSDPVSLRSTGHSGSEPTLRTPYTGFRCAHAQ